MDLRILARYPFLGEAAKRANPENLALDELLTNRGYERARALGYDRVLSALERFEIADRPTASDPDAVNELLSYPIARMIVSAASDPFLTRRYAVAEAKLAHRRFLEEDAPFLRTVAADLGLDLSPDDGGFRMHFTDFLKFTNQMRDKDWKLINQRVASGHVLLPKEKSVRVMQNAVQRKIDEELPLPVNDVILDTFDDEVREIRRLLGEHRKHWKAKDVGAIRITRFPPCMYNILAAIQSHENVSHMGRFAIVAFLHHLGLSNEEIYRVFGDVPDFAADVTKYQIDHITGTSGATEYTPPECSTMKSYSLCPGPDALCLTLTHPLTYYRRKAPQESRRGQGQTAVKGG